MDKKVIIGITAASIAVVATGAAAVLAIKKRFDKVFGEMQDDVDEQIFTSPNGENTVKVLYGASNTAKGMALISITATSKKDSHILLELARKGENLLTGEWVDDDHFKLLIGSCNSKQCYDISFDGEKIATNYSLCKVTAGK